MKRKPLHSHPTQYVTCDGVRHRYYCGCDHCAPKYQGGVTQEAWCWCRQATPEQLAAWTPLDAAALPSAS